MTRTNQLLASINQPQRVGLAVAKLDAIDKKSPYKNTELVAELVRQALLQAGFAQRNPTIPLADIIEPGMTVLLKPNWVLHNNLNGKGTDCLVTHHFFIEAVLKEVVAAKAGHIIIGDAPIQGCHWDELVTDELQQSFKKHCQTDQLEFIDFRRTVFIDYKHVYNHCRPMERYTLFDLGRDSLLEPVSTPPGRFRVTMYNPDELAKTHRPGRHQYLVCREPFEVDIILNLPKLKTHRKAGLTGALKNLVGLNGNKNYLPHHRVGGSGLGGDCYPGVAPLKSVAEYCLDMANRNINTNKSLIWLSLHHCIMKIHRGLCGDSELGGGWYGNDTVWRMALDLNRIFLYGHPDGSMDDEPQRRILSITDAILCGEGKGAPLVPEPRLVGAVTCSWSAPLADAVHAALLRLDWRRIPLLREAFGHFHWPLMSQISKMEIRSNDQQISLEEIAHEFGVDVEPAGGWAGHCEMER